MKRFLVLLLAFLLTAGLFGCKTKKENTGGKPSGGSASAASQSTASQSAAQSDDKTTLSSEKASHLAKNIEQGRFDSFADYSDEEKAQIKKSVEEDGYTLEYNDDGSATLSNDEGSWYVGKGWVDNEYTKDVPKIDFGTITMSAEEETDDEKFYIFLVRYASATQAADYVKALEQAGFQAKPEQKTVDIENGVISFDAENADGKKVSLGYSSKGLTMMISM